MTGYVHIFLKVIFVFFGSGQTHFWEAGVLFFAGGSTSSQILLGDALLRRFFWMTGYDVHFFLKFLFVLSHFLEAGVLFFAGVLLRDSSSDDDARSITKRVALWTDGGSPNFVVSKFTIHAIGDGCCCGCGACVVACAWRCGVSSVYALLCPLRRAANALAAVAIAAAPPSVSVGVVSSR